MLGWTTRRGGAPSERALSIPSVTGGLRPDAFITVEALEGKPGSPRIETHIRRRMRCSSVIDLSVGRESTYYRQCYAKDGLNGTSFL